MGLKWECPADQTCSRWALSYFFDCLCNERDLISFILGITSIICWAVAEIPQILLNWRSGNVEGVSLAFIFTWMIGDLFNLLGCWINPGTLPTQFYLAVLYSSTTVLLVVKQMQSLSNCSEDPPKSPRAEALLGRGRGRPPRGPSDLEESFRSDATLAIAPVTQSLPVMSKRGRPPLYVTASLPVRPYSQDAGGHTASPTSQSATRSPIAHSGSWRRLTLSSSYSGSGSPTARGLIFSSLVVVGVTVNALSHFDGKQGFKRGAFSSVGGERRQLLQEDDDKDIALSVGLILGWLMTCIYLTGRLPQVILNWSRDFVIGVSVQTVVFAFLGNATYLGSILVRGVEWSRLKPVLPWVVDIAFCLGMDIFMTAQFLIHHFNDGHIVLE
ncbi:unnamed protein product [Calypogeia fissa]